MPRCRESFCNCNNDDVFPCALIKGNLLVLASSAGLATEMAKTVPMPAAKVTKHGGAAGAVVMVDFKEFRVLLEGMVEAGFLYAAKTGAFQRDEMEMAVIRSHIDALWRSLGACWPVPA